MKKTKEKIIVILGPTASGKSDLAVELAREFKGEVISADSRQVYKGMNIGTGKITKKEMRGIPHHLLDVANPKSTYSVSKYQKAAKLAIERIEKKGKLPVICGGTGLYIKALVDNVVFPEVKPNHRLRKELETKTASELSAMLKKMDKRRWAEIDKQNPRRLIRAIEIANAIGKVPILSNKHQTDEGFLQIGIKVEPELLRNRIHRRLLKRVRAGMIAEIKCLRKQGVSWKRLDNFGLEYRYIARFLQNKLTKQEALNQLEKEIVSYAKRQLTWFKQDKRIIWIQSTEEADKLVKNYLAN